MYHPNVTRNQCKTIPSSSLLASPSPRTQDSSLSHHQCDINLKLCHCYLSGSCSPPLVATLCSSFRIGKMIILPDHLKCSSRSEQPGFSWRKHFFEALNICVFSKQICLKKGTKKAKSTHACHHYILGGGETCISIYIDIHPGSLTAKNP